MIDFTEAEIMLVNKLKDEFHDDFLTFMADYTKDILNRLPTTSGEHVANLCNEIIFSHFAYQMAKLCVVYKNEDFVQIIEGFIRTICAFAEPMQLQFKDFCKDKHNEDKS